MNGIKISIIIPVYNAGEYIDHCLDSIIKQDFVDYEVIMVDDGSTDTSCGICDSYAESDSRFRVVHQRNAGVSSARNVGIDLAGGEYLMFVDSDDALLPGALRTIYSASGGCDFVLGGHVTVCGNKSSKTLPGKERKYREGEMQFFFDNNILKNCIMLDSPWAKLFRRETVGQTRFFREISYAEDKLFVFTFLSHCRSAVTLPEAVYEYTVREGSLGSDCYSDRHLMQMRLFLPQFIPVVRTLQRSYPGSGRLSLLYHEDVIGRYVCRILNIFLTRRTALLTGEYLRWLYSLMDADSRLGVFSIRPGQIFNIILYKIGNVGLSVGIYKSISSSFGKILPSGRMKSK